MLNKYNLEITQFASKFEESCYSLQAIRVTPSETVATDGHRLVVVTTPGHEAKDFPMFDGFVATDEFEPFLLGLDAAKQIAKAIPKRNTIPILECVAVGAGTEETAKLAVTGLENPQVFAPRKVIGQFPDYVPKIPPLECAEPVGFNAKYLAEIFAAIAKFSDDSDVTCEIRLQAGGEPMRVDAKRGDGQRMTFVVAPVWI